MSEWSYVLAAFGLTWSVLVGYTLFLNARTNRAYLALRRADDEMEVER